MIPQEHLATIAARRNLELTSAGYCLRHATGQPVSYKEYKGTERLPIFQIGAEKFEDSCSILLRLLLPIF